MKRGFVFAFHVVLMVLVIPNSVQSDSTDEFFDRFNTQYESMVPAPGSSVNSDYKLSQIALGTKSTVEILTTLIRQNNEMSAKYEEMISKYDKILNQNEKIISILAGIKQEMATSREDAGKNSDVPEHGKQTE